jgi:predicted DsbA family dithiol-disulfide isomerase
MKADKHTHTWRTVFLPLLLTLVVLPLLFTRKQQASAPLVTITEFSDFQCPYCKRAASVVEQLRQSYGERVRFVFKQMPLPMHKQAFKAAQASVCAGKQGKFWEYHDRLFAASDLSVDVLNRASAEVGLNSAAFSQCLESQASRAMVEKDTAEAERLGVSGTPTFFVDGKAVKSAATFAALKQKIDGALTEQSSQPLPPVVPTSRSPQVSTANGSDRVNTGKAGAAPAAITPPKETRPTTNDKQQVASNTTTGGVTLSPASIDFGYQLVGVTSNQMVETVTNAGTAPLVITDISVSGRDRGDFMPTYSFVLPGTVAPGDSVDISLSFTPAPPWRKGTRNARLDIGAKKGPQRM